MLCERCGCVLSIYGPKIVKGYEKDRRFCAPCEMAIALRVGEAMRAAPRHRQSVASEAAGTWRRLEDAAVASVEFGLAWRAAPYKQPD